MATVTVYAAIGTYEFQSPSRGGHLRGYKPGAVEIAFTTFQSPSRGGHLRGVICVTDEVALLPFQSPSRGGHLRGIADASVRRRSA